jgi:hypothetical protein
MRKPSNARATPRRQNGIHGQNVKTLQRDVCIVEIAVHFHGFGNTWRRRGGPREIVRGGTMTGVPITHSW